MDYGRITTLNRRNQGFTGSGVDLTSSFLKILYIFFCAIHFLMFFVYCFLFLKFFYAGFSAVKTNEGHSQRSNCRKHHNHVLSSCHYWRCMWLRLSVCEWVFVRIHQGVIWNYFWQRRSISIAIFFGTKKKKRSPCSILAHLLLSPASLPFHI